MRHHQTARREHRQNILRHQTYKRFLRPVSQGNRNKNKNVMGSLIGIALNLQIALGSMAIFTILIFPIQEHGIYFHFFTSFLIFLINVLQFSAYKSFTSLVRYIPRYLILGGAILKCTVFLYSFSNISLLVYRNATDL